MRSIEESRARWEATFTNHANISDLRLAVKKSSSKSPCVIGLRSICWKTFLLFEDLDTTSWGKTLSNSRSAYTSMKEHFMQNIENSEHLSAEDPLTDTETSPWNNLRQDEELRAEILQDVERCMPENSYFREPSTQDILLEILFVYCKLNRDIGYRQGMHEVLAPILWVVSCDAIDPEGLDSTGSEPDNLLLKNLDQNYIEHDAFTLFASIMQTVRSFYEVGTNQDSSTSGLSNNSPIVERSKRIHENYLQHADPELAEHLTAIEILPQIFLIRWVRLLFGREFPFEDVLALWDVLFAEDPALELIDLISVSMLLRIRWQLLEADYSAALTLLLRYPVPPPPHGPPTFVSDAQYLRDNLLLDGGDHIISKYSRRSPETTVTRKLPKRVKRARTAEQEAARKAMVPTMSPSRYIQEQGGLESIIQEAAKGVYQRGEKWGVTKALRGAVQTLQSGTTSPRRSLDRSRWSLDSGKMVSENPAELISKIQSLETRNKSLAKMLERAMEDLWAQQKSRMESSPPTSHQPNDLTTTANTAEADALSLAIAKVQFVQVYLENSSMPLPPSPPEKVPSNPAASPLPPSPRTKPPSPPPMPSSNDTATDTTTPHLSATTGNHPTSSLSPEPSTPPRNPTPRPSISQSSYSWMLGDDAARKSPFVAVSPFSSPRRGKDLEKKGNLFGDEDDGRGFEGVRGKMWEKGDGGRKRPG